MKPLIEWDREALLRSPLFAPLHPALSRIETAGFPALADWNALLAMQQPAITVQAGHSLQFVAQEYGKLPFESQYEPRCYLKGEVQTRENNWHDFYNALVWLAFPKAKAAINARHYRALTSERETSSTQRGTVRDMNTLFDESGVVVVSADAELAELLRGFSWKELFWQRRERVQASMGFFLFGHGLFEKAMNPYVGLTGQGLVLEVGRGFFALSQARQLEQLDAMLADYLNAPEHCRSTRELTPLPLLGVPGWAAENERAEYYDNTGYFRPGRRAYAGFSVTSGNLIA